MKEIILIKTDQGEKIKSFLNKEGVFYETYREDENEEQIWRRDTRLATQDKERNKEIAEWDKISKVKDSQGW